MRCCATACALQRAALPPSPTSPPWPCSPSAISMAGLHAGHSRAPVVVLVGASRVARCWLVPGASASRAPTPPSSSASLPAWHPRRFRCDRTTLEPRYTTTVAAPAQSPHEPCKPRTHPPTTADARPACVGGPLLHVDIFEAAKPSAAELGTAQWIGRGDDD